MQGLMSRDSIVDRQFVTAWVIERLTTIRFMCHAVPSTVVRRRRFFFGGGGYCTECTGQGNPTVKMETRLPARDNLVINFRRSTIIAELWGSPV